MPTFDAGTIVRVPFPYTSGERTQFRPALVVSGEPLGADGRQFWAAMITSAENRGWPDDVAILDDFLDYGLTAPSVVRPHKIATLDVELAEVLGCLDADRLDQVTTHIRRALA